MSDYEDEEFEAEYPGGFYKPSYVLIAIDAHPSMFVKARTNDGPFREALTACYKVADSLMFIQSTRSWSPFAIAFARDDEAASFVNFSDNVLDTIKKLKQETELNSEEFIDKYQRKVKFDFAGFLLLCKKKFKEISSVYYKRTIIYITNDENPAMDKDQRFAAMNEAKHFEANDIAFHLVTMKPKFDYSSFYSELFSVMKQELVENYIEDYNGLVDKLSSTIVQKYFQKKLEFFPFPGCEQQHIRVVLKNFVQEFKLNSNKYVDNDGRTVKKVIKYEFEETMTFVLSYGDDKLTFDRQEMVEMNSNKLPIGYTLMFVSKPVTERGLVLSKPAVLECDHKEDPTQFNSFWQYCVNKKKVLICAKKLRAGGPLRFVEFIPKFANNTKHFVVKDIPFADEIVTPEEYPIKSEKASPKEIELINEIMNKLTFDYYPKLFDNPSTGMKKAFLKSKFLDEDQAEFEDTTLDTDAIDELLEPLLQQFYLMFGLAPETALKRKYAASGSQGRGKRMK